LTSFSIAWWIESRTRILTWLEIDIESSHEIDIEYSSWVTTLISSTQTSQKVGMKTQLDDQSNYKVQSYAFSCIIWCAETFQKFIKSVLTMLRLNAYVTLSYDIFYLLSHFRKVVDSRYSFNDFIWILMFMYHWLVIIAYYLLSTSCWNIDEILKC